MRRMLLHMAWLCSCLAATAQETFPVNGVADKRNNTIAFTGATVVKDAQTTLQNATLLVKDGKIIALGTQVAIPADAQVVDCKQKFIYPSLVDIYSDYGIAGPQRSQAAFDFRAPAQLTSNVKGAYGWNQALKSEVDAFKLFSSDEAKAKSLRDIGFGTVATHQRDGIVRGTGTVVTLQGGKENKAILKERATHHLSFNKGTSTQSYPSSLMGSIALLRQTYLDAAWYKSNPSAEGVNITLASFNQNQSLPQIFDVQDRGVDLWNVMRADRIGDEFGVQYILKATGKEYQRMKEVAGTKAPLIVTLNFPTAMDVEDPNDARLVSLADMKHWEMAPFNPAMIEKAGVPFCLTTSDLRDARSFWTNLRKAMEYGLSEKAALEALTKTPATLLGVFDQVGSLEVGKMANLLITNGPLFSEKTQILHNWVQGEKFVVRDDIWSSAAGTYALQIQHANGTSETLTLDVKSNSSATLVGKDTLNSRFTFDGKQVKIQFGPAARRRGPAMGGAQMPLPANAAKLSGYANDAQSWQGTGLDSNAQFFTWTAKLTKAADVASDSAQAKKTTPPTMGAVMYPFTAYGLETAPTQQNFLIKNATVWTSEANAVLENTDVLVKSGKISAIGKNLNDAAATVVDGTGKYLTAGIIDEHSHIASASTNEGGQSVTSEVRMQDNLDPDDINIYRQLSGGVTTSHILHGSANTIGGQTQLIKLRWGGNDQDIMFKNWDPFIKFALGENVKRTSSTSGNNRFPDTRMGVEQVLVDAFTRAKEYEAAMKEADANNKKKGATPMVVRRDLELDALVEIMNQKRFITCHSYVQSEILATMRVAERFGFRINTFTHILEGYKVAKEMKEHGANASTFSDWWAYKVEVTDAIPYNATLMNKMGLNVAINSDDAEMARRLNQEAAKAVKYGGMSEVDAWKMVTINPAKMLHVDDRVGSIKVGKDADLVLWNTNPLSIYAMPEKTFVDGILYFDREKDKAMRSTIQAERKRLIQKMVGEKREGRPVSFPMPSYKYIHTCLDHGHKLGMLEIEAEEDHDHEHIESSNK